MAYVIPPDNVVSGASGHIAAHNNMSDVLTGTGAGFSVLNFGADPTDSVSHTTQRTAFQNAINALPAGGGQVLVPPGTYTLDSTPLSPVSGLWLHGTSYQSTTIQSSTGSLFLMDIGSQLDVVEIDHLSLIVTGAFPIFSNMWITRSSVHHCYLQAHNAGAAIWQAGASGTMYMAECRFWENREQVWGATRSVAAWSLNAANTGTLFQVNDNHWHDNVCFDNDKDTTQWWYQLIYSGAFAGVTNNANTFNDIVFEFPCGGMVRLESCSYATIERLTCEDFSASAVGNPMISIVKNAGGGISQNTTIRDYTRRGGSVSITDVQLASTCVATEIDSPALSSGSALTIDLGTSTGNTLAGMPASAVILNGSTMTDMNRQPVAADLPVQPAGATGATMPRRNVTSSFTSIASGTLFLTAINLPASLVVTNITFITDGAAKTGGTHGWYVLCDSGRVVRAVSADQTDAATVWGTTSTAYPLPVTSGGTYTTTYSGLFYVGIMVAETAGSLPSFVSSPTLSSGVGSIAPILCGSSSTGLTTPPALGTTMAGISPLIGSDLYAYTT